MNRSTGMDLLCILSVVIAIAVGISQSSTVAVAPGQRIQAAIDSANPGDVVEVQSAIYYENLVVTKSLVLRGMGYPVVDARENGDAITISANRVTLTGFNATNSSNMGIKVASNDNLIAENIAANNEYCGIGLEVSSNNTISRNIVRDNGVSGIDLDGSGNNTLTGNIARENRDVGIEVEKTSRENNITKNTVINNSNDGIEILASYDNAVAGNVAEGNKDGICIEENSMNNTIRNNNASGNHIDGILLRGSTNNLILENDLAMNSKGIFLESSAENLIGDNNVSGNIDGIHLNYYSSRNRIYHNSFANSVNYNAYDEAGTNQWDDGLAGNHYSDNSACTDSNIDGICDSWHSIPGGSSIDRYPLVAWRKA